jgi:hypothetical protein
LVAAATRIAASAILREVSGATTSRSMRPPSSPIAVSSVAGWLVK